MKSHKILLWGSLCLALLWLTGCGGGSPSVGWAQPVLSQSLLYIGSTGGRVYALDLANCNPNCAPKWRFPSDSSTIPTLYATPVVGDQYLLVSSSNKRFYALNAATGQLQCEFETGDSLIASPAYAQGTVYVGSADGKLYALDPSRTEKVSAPAGLTDGIRHLFDSRGAERIQCVKKWEFAAKEKIWSEPLIIGDTIYVASLDSHLYALDRTSGKELWKFKADGAIASSPKHYDGVIYFGAFDTRVYALKISGTKPELLWRFNTGNWVWADPLILNDMLVIGSLDGRVYGLDFKNGNSKWVFPKPDEKPIGSVRARATGKEGVIFVGSEDKKIYALNVTNGAKVWEYDTGDRVLAAPELVNGTVIVQNVNHQVTALDASSGQKKWGFDTDK